ncbi:MAG: SIR2 family protein [Phocaeicola dorei]|nr:SIR2 family protein [Phocaeicola dorei]
MFSEDEYHNQYADLTNHETIKQLGVLDENICLYVGISFTDPNMRRLADAYIKEHQDRQTPHYLIKKIPDIHLNNENRFLSETKLLNQIMCLEELDAKSFGFQIIWLDNFDEIPQLFNDIKDKQNE